MAAGGMVNLKELVSQVLIEIADGINQAQGKGDSPHSLVVPRYVGSDGKGNSVDLHTTRMVHLVSFDISFEVIESEGKEGEGGARLSISGIGLGGKRSGSTSTSEKLVQGVKFNIPVLWPSHDNSMSEEAKIQQIQSKQAEIAQNKARRIVRNRDDRE